MRLKYSQVSRADVTTGLTTILLVNRNYVDEVVFRASINFRNSVTEGSECLVGRNRAIICYAVIVLDFLQEHEIR